MSVAEGDGRRSASPRVVLGVTGGIAAYKAVEVCRRLIDRGVHVVPVMTASASRFIGETTLSALASEPVVRHLFDEAEPIPHTRLGQQADAVVIVPATARFIGSFAAGIPDGLLGATVLATRAPVVLCPAMHTEMWEHPAVQDNLRTLRRRGVVVVEPEVGRLAGGDLGAGRLADPDRIVAAVVDVLDAASAVGDLTGCRVLVTAGGTREPIDAVRVVTNRSSGKQGHALAAAAAARGASVVLVTAAEQPVPAGVEVVRVETAAEMAAAVLGRADAVDVVVMAAAVADFRPVAPSAGKLRKADGPPTVTFEPTVDILSELGHHRRPGQVLVGFAAEAGDPVASARAKLDAKGVDLIVANDVSAPGAGFDVDTNIVTIVGRGEPPAHLSLRSKREVADAVLDRVRACLVEHRAASGVDPSLVGGAARADAVDGTGGGAVTAPGTDR